MLFRSWMVSIHFQNSQCAIDKRVYISDESFNDVSGETQEKHICEVLDGEGTDPVSSEEKDDNIFESASHADVSPHCECILGFSIYFSRNLWVKYSDISYY